MEGTAFPFSLLAHTRTVLAVAKMVDATPATMEDLSLGTLRKALTLWRAEVGMVIMKNVAMP